MQGVKGERCALCLFKAAPGDSRHRRGALSVVVAQTYMWFKKQSEDESERKTLVLSRHEPWASDGAIVGL